MLSVNPQVLGDVYTKFPCHQTLIADGLQDAYGCIRVFERSNNLYFLSP